MRFGSQSVQPAQGSDSCFPVPYAWCRPAILPCSLTALYRPRLTTSLLIPRKRGCQTKFKTSAETEILDKLLFSIKMFYTLHVCVHVHALQLCPTFCDPVDYSPPGSSVHGDSPGKNTGVGCHALLQGIFPIQGSNPRFLVYLHWEAGSLPPGATWESFIL